MAALVKKIKAWLNDSAPGQVIQVIAYAVMLLLVLSYFTGHGAFIYEAF
ncbi:MAG TPA: hypothetical protein IAD33_11570 [Candidatus Scatomorpha gallistercoris]|nr:hypothetical protein [Candidatus Scatomorpha gallistercoris]